jgi:NAD-dependent dihydropyrimidine dehydrogenase PreA subunit
MDDYTALHRLSRHWMRECLPGRLYLRIRRHRQGKISLYIDPDECIDCGACEPECPWQAIFEEPGVPDVLKDDIALNHAILEIKDQFKVKTFVQTEHPNPEQIAENKKKWGVDPNT